MRPIKEIIREESPVQLAREALWRSQRLWQQRRFGQAMREDQTIPGFRTFGYFQPDISRLGAPQAADIVACAGEIVAGRFPLLGYGTVDLGRFPDWNRDFVSGKAWPMLPSAQLDYVRHDASDVKVPWELSRLQFAPVLARAYLISGERAYCDRGLELISDWIRRNPVGVGVNWTVAMEAALRALSICWFFELAAGRTDSELHEMPVEVRRALFEHLRFIESHLEFSHLFRGNHYISNVLGMFALSHYLEAPGMRARRERYRSLLENEILLQVYDDGGDYEASTGYHAFVAEMFATAYRIGERGGTPLSAAYRERLARMFDLLAALLGDSRKIPQAGDCDDGRVELRAADLRQCVGVAREQRDSLEIAGLAGFGSALLGAAGGADEDLPWYGLRMPPRAGPAPRIRVFERTGVAVARAGDVELFFFAMPNGIGGKGSHTHNDKLSVVVRVGGSELLADSGTYCYTRDFQSRNRFRSTAAHNTLSVAGQEQNEIFSRPNTLFCIANQAQVAPIAATEVNGNIVLASSHSGYDRLGVVHRRTVALGPAGTVDITDQVLGSGARDLILHFHLGPEWRISACALQDRQAVCRCEGPRRATITVESDQPLRIAQVDGEHSRAYGVRVPAAGFNVMASAAPPFTAVTRVRIEN